MTNFQSRVASEPSDFHKTNFLPQSEPNFIFAESQTDQTHPGLTYLNWLKTYWGFVSELSLIRVWSKLSGRSKQGFDHIKVKIKMPNPSREPSASSKAPKQDLEDMDVPCTFKIKIVHKLGRWVYQRPVTISRSRSRDQTCDRNLQHPPKPHIRT